MIEQLVSVILPTMGRCERAVACIEQLLTTTQNWYVEVICPVDEDTETCEALDDLFGNYDDDNLVAGIVSFCPTRRGHIRAWNDGLVLARGEYIVFAADDLWWENGWLEEAMRAMRHLPDGWGLVGFNDLHNDGNLLSTHYILHRRFILQGMNGVLAFPCYEYCCNDTEANERAKRMGRFSWARNAVVRHDHPANGRREVDENDLRNTGLARRDMELFAARRAQGFPNDFEAVIRQ